MNEVKSAFALSDKEREELLKKDIRTKISQMHEKGISTCHADEAGIYKTDGHKKTYIKAYSRKG